MSRVWSARLGPGNPIQMVFGIQCTDDDDHYSDLELDYHFLLKFKI